MTEKQLVDFLNWLEASHYNEADCLDWLEFDMEYAPQIAAHYIRQWKVRPIECDLTGKPADDSTRVYQAPEVPTAVNSKPDNQRKYVLITNGGPFHGCIAEFVGIDSDNGMSRLIINGREVYMNHTEWEFVEKC